MPPMLQAPAAVAAPAADPAFEAKVWGRIVRVPARVGSREEVAVALDGYDRTTNLHHFRLRLRRQQRGGEAVDRWSDTRSCPAARTALARFVIVPMPSPKPPTMIPGDNEVVMDGIGYAVTLPVGYGKDLVTNPVTVRSNIGTPLAAWVETTLAQLGACWDDAPRR